MQFSKQKSLLTIQKRYQEQFHRIQKRLHQIYQTILKRYSPTIQNLLNFLKSISTYSVHHTLLMFFDVLSSTRQVRLAQLKNSPLVRRPRLQTVWFAFTPYSSFVSKTLTRDGYYTLFSRFCNSYFIIKSKKVFITPRLHSTGSLFI